MNAEDRIQEVLNSHELMQQLAAVEHERWAHWQRYLHDQCEQRNDGSLVIPPELVSRWEAQIATPYPLLSQTEKESDQEQVRKYLPVIISALTTYES